MISGKLRFVLLIVIEQHSFLRKMGNYLSFYLKMDILMTMLEKGYVAFVVYASFMF